MMILVICPFQSKSQKLTVFGYAMDTGGKALQEAIIHPKDNRNVFSVTDSSGFFKLLIDKKTYETDSLVVSYLGYKTFTSSFKDFANSTVIRLQKKDFLMSEIIVFSNKSLASDFSTSSIKKLDIYIDPTAQADPLNAIQSRPYSTNTLESATPMLRGSSTGFSRVFFNGIPIYYPTKGQQLKNSVTSSSAFNTSMVREEDIYASNPPIYYGNVSGGLIDLKLNRKSQNNKTLFLSMVGGGISTSVPFSKTNDEDFVEAYLNYTDLKPLKYLNKSLKNIRFYNSYDFGVHSQIKSGKSTVSLYSTLYRENGSYDSHIYSYDGNYHNTTISNNNIVNYRIESGRNLYEVDLSFSVYENKSKYGNMDLKKNHYFTYNSFAFSRFLSDKLQVKLGGIYENIKSKTIGEFPQFYYSYFPNAPTYQLNLSRSFNQAELFAFLKKNIGNFTSSAGFRYTFPEDYKPTLSYQFNLKYLLDKKNKFLFSIGNYYSRDFTNDFYFFPTQKGFQYTLEYFYYTPIFQVQLALYQKNEEGYQYDGYLKNKRVGHDVFGAEMMVKLQISEHLSLQASNLYLNSKIFRDKEEYRNFDKLNYFLKSILYYDHPSLFNISLSAFLRPGTYYTSIIDAQHDDNTGFYIPIYSNKLNDEQFNSYNSLNINISQGFKSRFFSGSVFCGINNIFNRKNQRQVIYNYGYKKKSYEYFTQRTFFLGCILHFK